MGQNMTYFGSFWVDFDPFWVIFGTPLFEVVPWVFRCFGLFWVIFGSKKGPKIGPNMTQNGSILGHFGSFWVIFEVPFWVTFGHPRGQIYVNPNLNMTPPEYRGSQI